MIDWALVDCSKHRWHHYWSIIFLLIHRSHVGAPPPKEVNLVSTFKMDYSKVIDENLSRQLQEMGFSYEEASVALSRSDNSIEGALAFLLQDEQVSQSNDSQGAVSREGPEIAEPHLLEDGDWEDVDEEVPEDPIKMMIAVNTEYNMSVGKTASQVAHAAVGLYSSISTNKRYWRFIHDWNEGGSKKIVVDGKDTATLKQLIEKAKNLKIKHCAIQDAGLTEVPPGAVTAVAFFGKTSLVDKVTSSLPLLKSKKIVVNGRNTATLKLLAEKAKKMKLKYCLICDTGLTEVPPNTVTAVAVFGRDSVVRKIFGQLPLLK